MTEIDDILSNLQDVGLLPLSDAPYKEGPATAKIAFVGEAPGKTEERYQRPFVGEAGDLFSELLQASGILRDACYIDNVFQFRPYQNNITPYIKFGRTKITTSPAI